MDLARGGGLDLLQQTLPRPVGRPQPMAFIHSSTGRSAREDPATALLQPDPGTGVGRLRLRTDRNTAIQLTTPKLQYGGGTPSSSRRRPSAPAASRGMKNPDGAEAILLAAYEPSRSAGGGLIV